MNCLSIDLQIYIFFTKVKEIFTDKFGQYDLNLGGFFSLRHRGKRSGSNFELYPSLSLSFYVVGP